MGQTSSKHTVLLSASCTLTSKRNLGQSQLFSEKLKKTFNLHVVRLEEPQSQPMSTDSVAVASSTGILSPKIVEQIPVGPESLYVSLCQLWKGIPIVLDA